MKNWVFELLIILSTGVPAVAMLTLGGCDATDESNDVVDIGHYAAELGDNSGTRDALFLESSDEEPTGSESAIELSEAPDVHYLSGDVILVTWTTSMPAIEIGPTSKWTCFLAKVSGTLGSSNDRAQVYVSDGRWYVSGAGGVAQVAAQCVSPSMATPELFEYTWSQSTFYARATGSSGSIGKTDRICGLTSLRGNFDGASDEVRAYTSGLAWLFGGRASTANQGISGTVQCARPAPLRCTRPGNSWSQGQAPVKLPVSLSPTPLDGSAFCVLTRVAGKFDTPKEWVGLWHSGSSVYLGGASTTHGISVEAQCTDGTLVKDPPPGWSDCL